MKTENPIEAFANAQAQATAEPDRRGITKGDPIGFGPAKVRAAGHIALDSRTEKAISHELGMSEGLLRKWNAEPGFRGLVGQQLRDFPEFFIDYVRVHPMPTSDVVPLGPAGEIALRGAVEGFLSAAELEWLIRASRHIEALVRAKAKAGELPKWVLRRYPNGEEATMYKLSGGEAGPLAIAFRLLRKELFERAKQLLDAPDLGPVERDRLREILRELQRSENAGQA
jgi:hypothetical protein